MSESSARRYYRGRHPQRAQDIYELRAMARRRLPRFAFEYLDGGSEDERSLSANRRGWARLRWLPRTLVDTTTRHARRPLFGTELPLPMLIAPTGLNGLLWRDGDIALARAAAAAGLPFTLSSVANARIEAVAAAVPGARLWMQLYVLRERRIAEQIVARAEAAGCEALVFTTDANVFGNRVWDRRNYRAPGYLDWRALADVACHPRWALNVMWPSGLPGFANIAEFLPAEARSARAGVGVVPRLFAPDIAWADVDWLRRRWSGRLLLKGILDPSDAERAAQHGCDGIVIGNHGGRQLDGCVGALEVLGEIRRRVGDRLALIVDGGVRRGGDVLKAVALGADAVMLGRATLYGLAAAGEAGARRALQILAEEIERDLGQLGCRSLEDLDAGRLWPPPPELARA